MTENANIEAGNEKAKASKNSSDALLSHPHPHPHLPQGNENEKVKEGTDSSAFLPHPHPHPHSPSPVPNKINLLEYIYVLVKHKWWIVGATVAGLVIGYVAEVIKGVAWAPVIAPAFCCAAFWYCIFRSHLSRTPCPVGHP